MSDLNDYLAQKRAALHARRARVAAGGASKALLRASAVAEGRSGVRRIRIRDHQVISDSPSDFAGYDLGPSSPELLTGALSSCLTHTFLIHASDLGVPLESLGAEVTSTIDARAGSKGNEHIPIHPHDFEYVVTLVSSAAPEAIAALHERVQTFCPILNLLRRAIEVKGSVIHRTPEANAKSAA